MGAKSCGNSIVGDESLTTLLFFIIAISLLVVIHEYGHFWVARRMGVQVLRFSVGFGNPLFKLYDRHGTEYSIAPIPLGGYVKMLDSREAPVPEHLKDRDFNSKSPWKRIAIAVAGPVANFIFAVLIFWGVFLLGSTQLVPVINQVEPNSIAAEVGIHSGDEILAVNGKQVDSQQDLHWELLNYIGETREISLTLENDAEIKRDVLIKLEDWLSDLDNPDPIGDLGIKLDSGLSLTVGGISPGGAAEKAGMLAGDTLIAVNGQPINDWQFWVDNVRSSANKEILVELERDNQVLTLVLVPNEVILDSGQIIGQVGVLGQFSEESLRRTNPNIFEAFVMGLVRTGELTQFTLESLWKTIKGDLSLKSLSGPITIAKVAGDSAAVGIISFITFLALLSVSLGVLNLLPIPMLDGGHILFYLIEVFRGKPLPDSIQIAAIKMGMIALFMMMSIAFYNDISRL